MTAERAAGGAPVGLMGGTFDPVHNGHLRVALEAVEALGLDHVRLLPLHRPSHRGPASATAEDRCAMIAACVRPPLVLDRLEVERGGVSYTVDTLETMRERFGRRSLCLLIGLDAYRTLTTWHRANELLTLAHIVVAARPDVAVPVAAGLDELCGNAQSDRVEDLHDTPSGRVIFLDIPLLPIASSELRARIRAHSSVRHLVPEAVDDIIQERHLYQT